MEWVIVILALIVGALFAEHLKLRERVSILDLDLKDAKYDMKRDRDEKYYTREWMALIEKHLKIEAYRQPRNLRFMDKS